MDKLNDKTDSRNINVTLGSGNPTIASLFGRKIPCQLCGAGLDIRISVKNKPYCICPDCGNQFFIRGKKGIQRLQELLDSGILIAGQSSKGDSPVVLFNRLQQLRAEKSDLEGKQGLILRDSDLENALCAVDNEIKRVQGELAKLGRNSKREKSK